jgi:hypothetical protein
MGGWFGRAVIIQSMHMRVSKVLPHPLSFVLKRKLKEAIDVKRQHS